MEPSPLMLTENSSFGPHVGFVTKGGLFSAIHVVAAPPSGVTVQVNDIALVSHVNDASSPGHTLAVARLNKKPAFV